MKLFKTIRGYLTQGRQEPVEIVQKYLAAVRIGGNSLDLQALTSALGVDPTRTHTKGDTRGATKFKDDMWLYESTDRISELDNLDAHLAHLIELFQHQTDLLKSLKKDGSVQVLLSYTTNLDATGVSISNHNTKLHEALDEPFDISFDYVG